MDESSHESSGARQSQRPDAAKTPASEPTAASSDGPRDEASSGAKEHMLPVVWSPKLDASEEIAEETPYTDAADAAASEQASAKEKPSATAAAPARSSRFALLAACVAIAAAVGSFAGVLSASSVAHVWPAAAAAPGATMASATRNVQDLRAEIAALKADLDNATRGANGQLGKLVERLDHVEHAQLDPAKLAHIADAVDRLEKHNEAPAKVTAAAAAAPETTGSIASSQAPAAGDAKQTEKILHDWVVQDVRGGHALVESRYGAVFTVMAGSVLPGLGHVEAIKRQDGEWTVVTEHGTITSAQ
jgi:hypothetical protein